MLRHLLENHITDLLADFDDLRITRGAMQDFMRIKVVSYKLYEVLDFSLSSVSTVVKLQLSVVEAAQTYAN
jgi:hypothetical protein